MDCRWEAHWTPHLRCCDPAQRHGAPVWLWQRLEPTGSGARRGGRGAGDTRLIFLRRAKVCARSDRRTTRRGPGPRKSSACTQIRTTIFRISLIVAFIAPSPSIGHQDTGCIAAIHSGYPPCLYSASLRSPPRKGSARLRQMVWRPDRT